MNIVECTRSLMLQTLHLALLVSLVILLNSAQPALANVVVVSNTIQAAINAANPGDTVRVPSGIYRENVLINKHDLTIEGSFGAILDGTGLPGDSGIKVSPLTSLARINGFRLIGLRIQNYRRNGVILVAVDGFQIEHGRYVNNGEYGIFPISSSRGVIAFNQVSGSNDTGIYLGQSRDTVIKENHIYDCTIGIGIELSSNVIVQDNQALGNTIGMTIDVVPGLSVTVAKGIQVIRNMLSRNNRPNPVTDPADILSQLPAGSGLLVIGADDVTAKQNLVMQNNSVGIAVVQLPPPLAALDPRINPFPDNAKIRDNVVVLNGGNPDPRIAPFPPSDLIWDFSGTGNCWEENIHRTAFPTILPQCQ